ncbi:Proteasome component-like protein [Emericellopsis cladophorae]|uniref:Proteasome component-like protein n=1 Tax=Emericellopsis cladophorae TaxID=2686198 RepID=A0A9Q0BAN5_9HYPO|nr:Proteasome component-like protein [Emericellopsis cladophorae]KAI6777891.1 Proteasome component-like protein [Emericellopsis cladophorae]
MAESTEQRELQLVESVEFKILAVANKELKLHELLQRYLPPVILKATSEHDTVRARVIQILGRLKTFIQPPQIILPVKALVQQYKSQDSLVVKHLDLSFIEHSIERLDDYERREILPVALPGISQDIDTPRAGPFFLIVLRLLLDAQIPPRGSKDDEAFRQNVGLDDPKDAHHVAHMIGLFIRLRTPTASQDWTQANPNWEARILDLFAVQNWSSLKIYQRLSELKAKLVALLASGAFTDEEKFFPALLAASSFDNRVASAAEEIIKRTSVSLEDEALVTKLFEAHATLPAAYRTRILNMLAKSSISTTMSNSILDVVNLDFMSDDAAGAQVALQPSSALEKTKLHKALFQYLTWVARMGPSKDDFTIAPQLIHKMTAYVNSQGWPSPDNISHDQVQLRSRAYETIGMLSRSADMPVQERLQLAQWLFDSLLKDPTQEAVVNIDGALSTLTANVPPEVGDKSEYLQTMLLSYMLWDEDYPMDAKYFPGYMSKQGPPIVRSTRHAVVKWANQCLSFSSVLGRWIDILAIGMGSAQGQGNKNDVVEQGHKGLDPWTYRVHNDATPDLPDWEEMVVMYFGTRITPASFSQPGSLEEVNDTPESLHRNFNGPYLTAVPVALQYIKRMMFLSALGSDFQLEPNWMEKLDSQVETSVSVREKIRKYLKDPDIDNGYWLLYLNACLSGALEKDSQIVEPCLRCFIDVASLASGGGLGYLANKAEDLLSLVTSNRKEVRHLAAQAFGILASHPINDERLVKDWRSRLQQSFTGAEKAVGSDVNAAEGALMAFGFLCSRSVYYDRPRAHEITYPTNFLLSETGPSSLHEAALEMFPQLWAAGLALPPNEGDADISKVISRLTAQAKKGNEKAIFALGRLAISLEDNDQPARDGNPLAEGKLGSIFKELFALHELKRTEVQFSVGDAICAAVARWDSNSVKLGLDVEARNEDFQSGIRTDMAKAVLDKLFTDCKTTKPSLLKASGIWLFCIVQYCSDLPEIQSRLREAQTAFMRLLSARDELVQETASRGLSLVYERGDADLKSTLTKDLVSAFTGSGTQLKVEEETELFEAGALPTGEGKSITSYKDIVNLANEVGDQRLVYKFMSLAANAATWTTRSAFGRFGLSNILSESEVDPKLYSKLYRYRFDPNPNVQRSMDDIWKALVKDSGSALDDHFDAILQDLLQSILGKEWRVRQASCAAISDLLQGRPFPQYEAHYQEVWAKALKVLDDVKGSVREAALKLCMALSTGLVRQLEENNSSAAAKAMMNEALPFLTSEKGMESSVDDVRVFATITVMKIAKRGGDALRPFIPDMVPQLLGLLSTIEPEQINYHYQRAGDDSRDKIDRLRSQMVNQSPISEAIENCLRFVDEDVMISLAPKLTATIKTAIGMPTKIGCSRVLTTLFTRHAADIEPFSAGLLKLMEKQILDKNDEVSQAYARAAAYIMRVVSDADKTRFSRRLVEMYVQAEEDSRRQKIADVVLSLAKLSADHFTANETELLPFAYLGLHDIDQYTSKVFKEVWEQHAGSSRTVVRYAPEIVKLADGCLETTQWGLRHTAAFTVGAMVADVAGASDATGSISDTNLKLLWPIFDRVLALKTFPGKEKVLESFPKFVEKGASLLEDPKIAAQMQKIALREAKRNNEEYRVHAFKALWQFIQARNSPEDMLQDVIAIVTPWLDDFAEDKMEIDSKDTKEDLASKTATNGFQSIARGYSRRQLQREPSTVLAKIVDTLSPYMSNPKFFAIKREVWYDAVLDAMQAAAEQSNPPGEDNGTSLKFLESLDVEQAEAGNEGQRVRRAEAIGAVAKAMQAKVFGPDGPSIAAFEHQVQIAVGRERALKPQRALKEAAEELGKAMRSS